MDAPVGYALRETDRMRCKKVVCQYDIYHCTVNVIYSISPVMYI